MVTDTAGGVGDKSNKYWDEKRCGVVGTAHDSGTIIHKSQPFLSHSPQAGYQQYSPTWFLVFHEGDGRHVRISFLSIQCDSIPEEHASNA